MQKHRADKGTSGKLVYPAPGWTDDQGFMAF